MKKTLLAGLSLFLFFTYSNASHDYGGEMEVVSLGNYQYQVNVIRYADQIGTPPPQSIQLSIYSNTSGSSVMNQNMPLTQWDTIFFDTACANLLYNTDLARYETIVTLDSSYTDAGGYTFSTYHFFYILFFRST